MNDISVFIIDKDPTANQVLKNYVENIVNFNFCEQFLNIKDAYDLVYKKMPKLIILDIDYGEEIVLDILSNILKHNKDIKCILTVKNIDAQKIIKYKKAGVSEIILKPFIEKEVKEKLNKVINLVKFNSEQINKNIITVFSNKGGIGKTVIATNLAMQIADLTKEPTIIVDFNSQWGDVGTFLNISSDFGIAYLLGNKSKLNKEFLLSILPRYKDSNLYILTDYFHIHNVDEISLQDIQDIINALKTTFSNIVIDVTNTIDLKTIKIFDNSNKIIFPIVSNAPNLRNCQRCLDFFRKNNYSEDKIKLILNRVTKADEIKLSTIEKILDKKVFAKIENDYFSVLTAINRGVGIEEVNSELPIIKDIQKLAYLLVREKDEE